MIRDELDDKQDVDEKEEIDDKQKVDVKEKVDDEEEIVDKFKKQKIVYFTNTFTIIPRSILGQQT